jgi:hypothetical protein
LIYVLTTENFPSTVAARVFGICTLSASNLAVSTSDRFLDLIIDVLKGVQVRIQSLLNSLIILYALEIRGLPLSCVGLLFQIIELSRF